MNMKKYFTVTMIVAGILVGVSALAATSVTLTPANVSVKAGQTFIVTVSANPQGVKNYSVELKLNYPASLLQVKSFALGSQWMALSQPGYDLIDNTNGVLIKTAGYPQGFNSNAQFGTVTFQAKKAGSGVIALASGTTALDQSNQNVFAGSSQVTVSITAPAVKTTPTITATPTSGAQPSQSPAASESISPAAMVQPSAQQASILGIIGNVLSLGTGNWLIALIVILAVAYAVFRLIKRARKNK
jgi:hypothetical protein